jgi:hypothetical protein
MGMLSTSVLKINQFIKAKFRLFGTQSHPLIIRRIETQNAHISAQQSIQNWELNILTQPALYWPLRQPDKVNGKPCPCHPEGAIIAQKSNK